MGNKKLAILFFLSVILAFFSGYFSSTVVENQSSTYSSEVFTYITDILEAYYYYDLEDNEQSEAFIASIEAVIDQYALDNHDPYTRLNVVPTNITPSDTEYFEGLGITFTFNDDHELVIYDVMMESSVFRLIYPNDIITGIVINDERVMFSNITENEVVTYLSGVVNEVKNLIVVNPDGDESVVTAFYKRINTPTAYTDETINNDSIAYIKITEFSGYEQNVTAGTSQVFANVLLELEHAILTDETKTLIIDLRDNPGGALTALNNPESNQPAGITQQLLTNDPAHPIFSMTDSNHTTTNFYGRLNELKDYDIKVLVNNHSASAAEVLAATLMDAGYDLYGEETYGKGVYQNTVYLEAFSNATYNFYLTFTEGVWTYGNGLNVMNTPLIVHPLEQTGMYVIELPAYTGAVSIDQVSDGLSQYQIFLNTYYNLSGEDMIRTDGYFDLETQTLISQFQTDMNIEVTGILDLETSHVIYEYFKTIRADLAYDVQLQSLIALIEGE